VTRSRHARKALLGVEMASSQTASCKRENHMALEARAIAEIDLEALQHNIRVLKSKAPHAKMLAMVKANAYGHGISTCLPALSESDALGVACLEEAEELKALGCQKPIVVMEGCFTVIAFQWCAKNQVHPVIHCLSQIETLVKMHLAETLTIWLEVDTGMHRLGIMPADLSAAMAALTACQKVKIQCCFSHFSEASETPNQKTDLQLDSFQQCAPDLVGDKSFANSVSILCMPEVHYEWVRPGIALYGVSPFAGKTGQDFGLKPVMRLCAPLIAKRFVPGGEAVGYASQWHAPKEGAWVGTVGIGYGDGYPWQPSATTSVWINGKIAPVIGRISMDSLVIDLTRCELAEIGGWVTLWGAPLPVEQVAAEIQRISYVLLASLTARVVRCPIRHCEP
jgi:alanine racemase